MRCNGWINQEKGQMLLKNRGIKYSNGLIWTCGLLATYIFLITGFFTTIAYVNLGFLPGDSETVGEGFSISSYILSNRGNSYFLILKVFNEPLLPALIAFSVLSLPTLVLLCYKLFICGKYSILYVSCFLVTTFLLIGLFSKRLGIDEWVRCLLCWYF